MPKYYLVPPHKIKMVETQSAQASQSRDAEFERATQEIKDAEVRDEARAFAVMLKELEQLTIRNGVITVDGDAKAGAISARTLIVGLTDDAPLKPAVKTFLVRLREVAGSSAPEARP